MDLEGSSMDEFDFEEENDMQNHQYLEECDPYQENYTSPYTFNPYLPQYGYIYPSIPGANISNPISEELGSDDVEEENDSSEQRVWYRIPDEGKFEEETRTLLFKGFPFSERALEFKTHGSIKLFRVRPSQRCTEKILNLIGSSRIFKVDYNQTIRELSLHESVSHLIESPIVKEGESRWRIPKKGFVQASISQQLKDSLTKGSTDPKFSVSNLLKITDNNLTFEGADEYSKAVFGSLQAEKFSTSSSDIGGIFKDKLPQPKEQEASQEKFLRKMLMTMLKGSTLVDLAKDCLDPKTLDKFQSLDELKVHCMNVGQTLAASRSLTDSLNISLTKEWSGMKTKMREKITEVVQPEELRTAMQEADLWVEGIWSPLQKSEFLEKARSLDALRSFRITPNPAIKRKGDNSDGRSSRYGNRGHRCLICF